jgi:hypothetical protein
MSVKFYALYIPISAGTHDFNHVVPDAPSILGQFRGNAQLVFMAGDPVHIPVEHQQPDILVPILHYINAAGQENNEFWIDLEQLARNGDIAVTVDLHPCRRERPGSPSTWGLRPHA